VCVDSGPGSIPRLPWEKDVEMLENEILRELLMCVLTRFLKWSNCKPECAGDQRMDFAKRSDLLGQNRSLRCSGAEGEAL
jgi:hypothetical protein